MSVVFFHVEVSATGRSPVQRSPTFRVCIIECDQVQQYPTICTPKMSRYKEVRIRNQESANIQARLEDIYFWIYLKISSQPKVHLILYKSCVRRIHDSSKRYSNNSITNTKHIYITIDPYAYFTPPPPSHTIRYDLSKWRRS